MHDIILLGVSIAAGLAVWAALSFGRIAKSKDWQATVPPLASIIGSGFLICGPLLAREFGWLALPAMMLLLALAYAVGAVIRYNIAHAEPELEAAHPQGVIAWTARIGQGVLAAAYAISIAYYLKLLALFALRPLGLDSEFASNVGVSAILALLALLSFTGGLRRVERVAEASVAAKLGLIAAMLVALALGWAFADGTAGPPAPAPQLRPYSILMLLGLLITVQGFETSRYMGELYDARTRIRTMRWAQWIATAIYLAFLALLTPRLGQAAATEGVAGVLDVMESIAPMLGGIVLAAAVASQLSAAVADAIGSTGISVELSGKRLSIGTSFLIAAALAAAVTWLTDATAIIVVASRAFAVFYAIQCVLGLMVTWNRGDRHPLRYAGIALIGVACLVAAVAGAPAEG